MQRVAEMRAMLLERAGAPLRLAELPVPEPAPGQQLIRVEACGVCRTDLHLADGELGVAELPRVLGHQIVGRVEPGGERVGVPWLGWTCGECVYCQAGRENLCPQARFTGRDIDGGFAEYAVADRRFCFPVAEELDPLGAAPLLCAGLIGYRALRFCGEAERLGLYGFGAAAHIVLQVARHKGRRAFAFTRAGDAAAQRLARELGAEWAGSSEEDPPEELDAALIFAPVGELVPAALRRVRPGGSVVCAGIHMSRIPAFDYELLWGERVLRSVANLTREDGRELLGLAARLAIETRVAGYPLERAGDALDDLRAGRVSGAAVIDLRAKR